ncbi:MAG: hypothetical protein ABI885_15015, partial [Gammaproteobacteria bacterium]
GDRFTLADQADGPALAWATVWDDAAARDRFVATLRRALGKLPRPDLVKRPYMLGPMAELAPEVIHPTANVSIGELWRQFDQASHAMIRLRHPGGRHQEKSATNPHCGRRPRQGSDP